MKRLFIAVLCMMTLFGCSSNTTNQTDDKYVSEDEKKMNEREKEREEHLQGVIASDEYEFSIIEDIDGYDYFQMNFRIKGFEKKYYINLFDLKNHQLHYSFYYDNKKMYSHQEEIVNESQEKTDEYIYGITEIKVKHQDLSKIRFYQFVLDCDGKKITLKIKNKYYKG